MRKVIVNSTPIISLYKVNRLDLLCLMYGCIYIPNSVYIEISRKNDGIREYIDNSEWIYVESVASGLDRQMYKAKLHDGEVEVMMLAQECDEHLVVIDDGPARSTAEYLGLNLTGTIGVIIKAKEKGYITSVMDIVNEMRTQGIYFSDWLLDVIKKVACE